LIHLTLKKKEKHLQRKRKQHRKKKEDEMADSIQLLFTAAKTKGSEWERVSDV
jgi:hypothetical protein